jgi:RNA polymerase sigma factor for flagellar operon FliA
MNTEIQPNQSIDDARYDIDQQKKQLFLQLERGRWFEEGETVLDALRLNKTAHEAFQELILMYQPLVYFLASKFSHDVAEHEDVVMDGQIGLMKALAKYRVAEQNDFATYAIPVITGHILDEKRKQPLPNGTHSHSVIRNQSLVTREYNHLQQLLNRKPSCKEIAARLDMKPTYVQDVLEALKPVTSFDAPLAQEADNEDANTLHDLVVDNSIVPIEDIIEEFESYSELNAAVSLLPKREQLVVQLYFQNNYTLKEIGEMLQLSESRACQLVNRSIAKLRRRLSESNLC